jgi:hypothetical protein
MTHMIIWPTFLNGQWYSEYKSAHGNIMFSQPTITEEQKQELIASVEK